MFIGVRELEQHQLTFQEEFAPGTIDFRTRDFRQAGPLRAEVVAELAGRQIHIVGRLATRLELACARCLEPVVEELAPSFDLHYRPVATISREEEIELRPEDADIGFFTGQGFFLADVLAEQVHLALPIKVLCREECQGLCPRCGANRNRERCRCGRPQPDPRLAPLADWLAKRKEPSKI
ncbi:MAG: YceD family protein [Candidatus Acidiferrales bacterium]